VPDLLTTTARQVRIDRKDSIVHELARAWTDWTFGRSYRTRCGQIYAAVADAAILTTRPVNCGPCQRGGR
jgi:hypothetical protein